jgi:hypothetical protein
MKTGATSSALTSGGTFTPVSTVSTPTAIPAPMTDAESPGQALTAFLDRHQARQWSLRLARTPLGQTMKHWFCDSYGPSLM